MSAKVKRDKTALFQAFEAELRASSSKLGARDLTLNEAESVLYPFFENISLLRKALGAGALTYEANFLSSKKNRTLGYRLRKHFAWRIQNCSVG